MGGNGIHNIVANSVIGAALPKKFSFSGFRLSGGLAGCNSYNISLRLSQDVFSRSPPLIRFLSFQLVFSACGFLFSGSGGVLPVFRSLACALSFCLFFSITLSLVIVALYFYPYKV